MASYLAPQHRDINICKDYTDGISTIIISEKYNTSVHNVYRILYKNKIQMRNKELSIRKYKTNQEFFNEVDSEEKAYILGFLYADGYNNVKDRVIKLVLQEKDKEILGIINNLIQPDKPLYFLDHSRRRSLGNKVSDCYSMSISSEKMCEDLIRLGCPQAKTFNLIFPNTSQVPKEYVSHFIRGYFDGDGSIYINATNKRQRFSLVGTESFLTSLQSIITSELGITKTMLYKPSNTVKNNIAVLSYCGLNDCIKIQEYLYNNSTIYMERKYNKFNSLRKGVISV